MNDSNKNENPPPVGLDSDGVAIHLSYIRRDIDEIKSNQSKNNTEIKTAITNLQNSYITRVDFDNHLKTDEDHETRLRVIEENMWKRIGATGLISSIGSAVLLATIEYVLKIHG